MKWIRDGRVESHLKQMGIDYKIKTVKIKDIDLEESLNRQVRVGKKLNDDWTTEYAIAMLEPGAAFPMPILNELKNVIWIWSGNHRVNAAVSASIDEVEAYVVAVTDPRLQDVIPRVVNAWEGRRPSREELLAHAAFMIENHRMEPKEVGRMLSLRYEWVVSYMRTQQIAQKIKDEGVNPNGFSKTMMIWLSPLANDSGTLRETAKMLIRNKEMMTVDDQKQMLEEMKTCDTERQKIQTLKDWENIISQRMEKKALPFSTKQRTQFLAHLSRFRNFITKVRKVSELQLAPGDEQQVAQYWNEIEINMRRLIREQKEAAV